MISLLLLMLSWGLTWQVTKINSDRMASHWLKKKNPLRHGVNWGFLLGSVSLVAIKTGESFAFLGPVVGLAVAFSVEQYRSERISCRHRQERLVAFRVLVGLVRGGADMSTALMRVRLISNPSLGFTKQLETEMNLEKEPLIATIWRLMLLSHERHIALLDATDRAIRLAARFESLSQVVRDLRMGIALQTSVAFLVPWGVAGMLWWFYGPPPQGQGAISLAQFYLFGAVFLFQMFGINLALRAVRFF